MNKLLFLQNQFDNINPNTSMKYLITSLLLLCLLSCGKENSPEIDTQLPPTANTSSQRVDHIEYFGFTLVDTYWDDPSDSEVKTNYADEIHPFCNMADLIMIQPTDDIVQRVELLHSLDMKALIHMNELFFELVDGNGPSGANYDLRKNYEDRWCDFITVNKSILNKEKIGTFYVGEEPTWNGISFEELDIVTNLIKADYPDIPVMIIEAFPVLDQLQIPEQADWIGFDHYFIKNPRTSPQFQREWRTIKSKRSHPSQRFVLIMDTHYIDWAHGDFGGIELDEMDDVANNYYDLAKEEEDVIGLIGYFWPNGFDIPESIGARGMPQDIKEEYERIGKEITGKE
ncbi:MAG: hypothetical protein AAFV95_10790 [Bacteroidota bacterium]